MIKWSNRNHKIPYRFDKTFVFTKEDYKLSNPIAEAKEQSITPTTTYVDIVARQLEM